MHLKDKHRTSFTLWFCSTCLIGLFFSQYQLLPNLSLIKIWSWLPKVLLGHTKDYAFGVLFALITSVHLLLGWIIHGLIIIGLSFIREKLPRS
jgi:hypothetical protein